MTHSLRGGWHEKSLCYCGRSAGVRSNKRERSGARGTGGSGCSLRSGRAWTGRGRSGWGDRLYGGANHRALVEKIRTATPWAVRKTANGTSNQRSARYKCPAAGSHGNCCETRRGSSPIGRSPKRNGARRAAGIRGVASCRLAGIKKDFIGVDANTGMRRRRSPHGRDFGADPDFNREDQHFASGPRIARFRPLYAAACRAEAA